MQFQPNFESLRKHQIPAWFNDAKLGIMVTWGLYSVPGWAVPSGDLSDFAAKGEWPAYFRNNPYAEWYLNTMKFAGGPTQRYHVETFGQQFAYDDFVPMFNEASRHWNADGWADLFKKAAAQYVVLISKHCDTFLMWPSAHPTRRKTIRYAADRDIVGELTAAVRAAGMRMGLYYCGGMDWVYNPKIVQEFSDVFSTAPQEAEFVDYVTTHWHELIARYQPSIMWGDIGYPVAADVAALFAYYYNQVPDGVINDQFGQVLAQTTPVEEGVIVNPAGKHFDFKTPEYTGYDHIVDYKWETVRGLGHSFGYNRLEGPEHTIALDKLIYLLADVVSKNGNLLLGVGPMADGTIAAIQQERLVGLGKWLAVNGESIFGTRPWLRAEGKTREGIPVRFTRKGDELYAILLSGSAPLSVTLEHLPVAPNTTIEILGNRDRLGWQQNGDQLTIELPAGLADSPARALRISPAPGR